MVDVYNEIYTKLKTTLTTATVLTTYPNEDAKFPCVIVSEVSNTTHGDSVDNSGETHSVISLEIGIYTNSSSKESDARKSRNSVDSVMSGFYNFNRDSANPVPNYADKRFIDM